MPLLMFPHRRRATDDEPAAAVWPYRTTPMETIDRVMDMQCALFELALVTNNYYRLQILLMMLTGFMMIVFDSFGVLDLLYNHEKSVARLNIV